MTVGVLIEKLVALGRPELEVVVYVQEDMDMANGVKLEKRGEETLYCKGDHMLSCYPELEEIVVIH